MGVQGHISMNGIKAQVKGSNLNTLVLEYREMAVKTLKSHQEFLAQAKMSFSRMKSVPANKYIITLTRRRALENHIKTILVYECKGWTISRQLLMKPEVTEMCFLQRML